jgi:hypothetical protein
MNIEKITGNKQEHGMIAAGVGVLGGLYAIKNNLLPQFLGVYTDLVVGLGLMILAVKFIKNELGMAFTLGLGFAVGLNGVLKLALNNSLTSYV